MSNSVTSLRMILHILRLCHLFSNYSCFQLYCLFHQVPESRDYLSLTSSIPSIVLHNGCTSWRTILRKKLLSLDKVIHEYVMGLCETHIPNLLAFLSPLFQNGPQIDGVGVSPSPSQEAVISCQQIVFNELQLIKSLCEILQVCTWSGHVYIFMYAHVSTIFKYSRHVYMYMYVLSKYYMYLQV